MPPLRQGYLLIGDRHTGAIDSHDWEKVEEDDSGEAPVSIDEIRFLVALDEAEDLVAVVVAGKEKRRDDYDKSQHQFDSAAVAGSYGSSVALVEVVKVRA